MFKKQKIIEYLNLHKDELKDIYNWKTNFDFLLEPLLTKFNDEIKKVKGKVTDFDKDEAFKNVISKEFKDKKCQPVFIGIAKKIIRNWGGINSINEKKTEKLIRDFLNTGNIGFQRISSISKVAAMVEPEKYFIYDSRVSYAMNWILLSQNAGDKFFPVPEGRNSKMLAFDINVLIHLKHIEKYQANKGDDKSKKNFISNKDSKLYIPKKQAYEKMNELITDVNKELWNNFRKNEPFYTGMLLFAIADTIVYDEITESVNIQIKQN